MKEKKKKKLISFNQSGKMVGFVGKTIKKLSAHSPWTLIGVLTGFLVFAISLPVLLNKSTTTNEVNKEITRPSPPSKRKSRRID